MILAPAVSVYSEYHKERTQSIVKWVQRKFMFIWKYTDGQNRKVFSFQNLVNVKTEQ